MPGSASNLVSVEPYGEDGPDWDDFVRATPGATFFHLLGWRFVLERAFGFRPHYLVARRRGRIVGVLPLCELSRPFGGSCLMSLPFAVEGGICALDAEAQRGLEAAAIDLGRALETDYVELRDGAESEQFQVRAASYFRFRREMTSSDDDNLARVPRKQRRMIRVGQRSGLKARIGDDFGAFYDLYARSVRRLGTPVFPLSYFQLLRRRFGEECALLTVWHGATPVAAVLSFFFRDTVLPYYAGSRRDLPGFAANDFMYWELMRHAARRGLRRFDFGRSRAGSGAFAFKRHWGFEPEPLHYRVHCFADSELPERSLSTAPIQVLRRFWRYLPLWLTKLAGPPIVRRMGPYYT
jgi:FemAB-related protein (PEP-CTERM system-associated)